MNLDFFAVMSNLVSLFALIAVGYFAVRLGILNRSVSSQFTALLIKITLPCTIFISLAGRKYDPKFVHDSMIILISGMIILVAILYSSRFIAKILNVPEGSRGVFAFACTFSNSGFMGFPICLALFGSEGLALAVIFNIALNIVLYTLGEIEISRDSFITEKNSQKLNIKSVIFSSINFAIVLSLIFYFGQLNIPEILAIPLNYLSNITTPLSMIIIGIFLSDSKGLEVFTDKNVWECSIIKLVIVPLILIAIFRFFTPSENPLVRAVIITIMSMPPVSVTTALTEIHNGNVNFAAKIMFVQNLFCIITIPSVCMII